MPAEGKVLGLLAVNFGQRVRTLTTVGRLQPTPEFPIDAVEDDIEASKDQDGDSREA